VRRDGIRCQQCGGHRLLTITEITRWARLLEGLPAGRSSWRPCSCPDSPVAAFVVGTDEHEQLMRQIAEAEALDRAEARRHI